MHYWLIKTEPETFGWAQQMALGDAGGIWDGVRNHQAANFLRAMQAGDRAFFYHTGKERQIVGVVEVVRTAFPDPTDPSGRFVSISPRALYTLAAPVPLVSLREDPRFAECLLLRQPRLSVMPITAAEWSAIHEIARTAMT